MNATRNPIDGAEMVYVPANEFKMGLSEAEVAAFCANTGTNPSSMEIMRPQRVVALDAFWIYKTPVTFGQYRQYCQATRRKDMARNTIYVSSGELEMDDDYPVCNVTWADANKYCKWAGVQLPSEAQWELAARGTDGRLYPWGNEWEASRANFSRRTPATVEYPVHVNEYPGGISPFGALQMSGNVIEWCADNFAPYGFDAAPFKNILEYWSFRHANGTKDNAEPVLKNPTGPDKGFGRVVRGGGWGNANGDWAGLTAYRSSEKQTSSRRDLGFRPILIARAEDET